MQNGTDILLFGGVSHWCVTSRSRGSQVETAFEPRSRRLWLNPTAGCNDGDWFPAITNRHGELFVSFDPFVVPNQKKSHKRLKNTSFAPPHWTPPYLLQMLGLLHIVAHHDLRKELKTRANAPVSHKWELDFDLITLSGIFGCGSRKNRTHQNPDPTPAQHILRTCLSPSRLVVLDVKNAWKWHWNLCSEHHRIICACLK